MNQNINMYLETLSYEPVIQLKHPLMGYISEHDMSIVSEAIKDISESSLNKATNAYKKNMKTIQKVLKDFGVDVSLAKITAFKISKKVTNGMKQGKSMENVSNSIMTDINISTKKAFAKVKKKVDDKINDMTMREKILSSLVIFFVMFISGIFLIGIVTPIVMSTSGSKQLIFNITTLAIGPLTEEAAKAFALQKNYPWVYTGIFAGIEAIQYTLMLAMDGANIIKAIIVRALAVLMHFSTTIIQKLIIDKFDNNTKMVTIAFITGVAIHVIFNYILMTNNIAVLKWLGMTV